MEYAETGRFHFIHTPMGCVWNGKGLSHGLKTCHWHVFLTPFRVPPGASKIAYPKGIRQKQDVSIPSTPLRGASEMAKDSPTG